MGSVLALSLLYEGVVAQCIADFDPDPSPVAFSRGWREPYKQDNEGVGGANRIILMPGDEAGVGGTDLPPRNPGRDPRPLATEDERFTWFIFAVDSSDLTDEWKQYEAARLLFDGWRRWLYLATHTDGDVGVGPVTLGQWRWNKNTVERGFGAEIIVPGSMHAMVPDQKPELVTGVTATVEVTVQGEVNIINT